LTAPAEQERHANRMMTLSVARRQRRSEELRRSRTMRVMKIVSLASIAAMISQTALAGVPDPLLPRNLSPWGMFLNADIVVKAVMVGLAFASLVTWTVWLTKTIELRSARRIALRRIRMLEGGGGLGEALRACGDERDAVAQLITSTAREAELSGGIIDDGFKERVGLRLERVEVAMTRQISRGAGILATIGATAPFVGLFGTVWGIMNAFIGISESQTTNLAVVAPGIAEALLATALGLVAAIPAVMIYNHLARVIAGYRTLLGDASAQLLLMVSRGQLRRAASVQHAAE
jgi:biopolymer transport protein ExbB